MTGAERWKRLTMPQRELLWTLARRPQHVAEFYAPRKKLLALDLIRVSRLEQVMLTPDGWVTLQPYWALPEGAVFTATKRDNDCVVSATQEGETTTCRAADFVFALEALKIALGVK